MVNSQSANSVTLDKNLTTIGQYAFRNCVSIKTLIVENSVTSIGVGAFNGCNALADITLPFVGENSSTDSGYTQVFGYIFGYETTQTEGTVMQMTGYYYYIPQSLVSVTITVETAITQYAFTNCNMLQNVRLEAVTYISDYAFYGCGGLQSVTVLAQTPPAITEYTFEVGEDITVYVPAESVEAYKADSSWNKFNMQAIA